MEIFVGSFVVNSREKKNRKKIVQLQQSSIVFYFSNSKICTQSKSSIYITVDILFEGICILFHQIGDKTKTTCPFKRSQSILAIIWDDQKPCIPKIVNKVCVFTINTVYS